MTVVNELYFISICLEGFLYGKICVLTCTRALAKGVQLFPGQGFYSGIFAIYLQCPSKRSGTALVLFYAVCLLYILSIATFVGDLVALILQVSNNSICKNTIFLSESVVQTRAETLSPQLQTDSQPMIFRILIVQAIASGCCDFLTQCILVRINSDHCTCHPFYWPKSSKIYRCWIVWGKNIRVAIFPSILAIAYLGQLSYLYLISWFQFIASSYLARANWRNNICTRWNWDCWLGGPDGFNRSRRVHGRECPGDGLDRFQDPQGVLRSKPYFSRANFGLGLDRGYKTSAHYIRNNWIRHDIVSHPTDSPRLCHPANGVDHWC